MFNKNAFKIQLQTKLKQFTAITLAAILSISSLSISTPLTAYATEDGPQDSGGNTGGGDHGVGDYADLDFKGPPAWKLSYQGYRFYVIKDLERISDIYDYTFTPPDSKVRDFLFETRFDGPNSPSAKLGDGHVHAFNIKGDNSFYTACHATVDVPYPIIKNGNYKGNGQAFKEWFMGSGDPYSAPTPSNPTGTGNRKPTTGNQTGTGGTSGSGGGESELPGTVKSAISTGKSSYNAHIDWDRIYREYDAKLSTGGYTPLNSELQDAINADVAKVATQYSSTFKSQVITYLSTYDTMTIEESKYAAMSALCNKYITGSAQGLSAGEYIFLLAMCKLFDNFALSARDEQIIINRRGAVNITITSSDLLFQNIPLASTTAEGGKYPLAWFGQLENKPDGFYMPDYVDKYKDLGSALDDGCGLVVEPLTWINIRTNPRNVTDKDWGAASSYKSTKTYGSYYNICQEWQSTGGTYGSIIDYTLPNCMATSKDFITASGYKVIAPSDYTSRKYASEGKALVNRGVPNGTERYGLAMHLYSNQGGGSSSDTSTYDEPQGNTPAPSEDCSTFPEETSYGLTSKKVTIVKNYVTRDSSTGVETVDGNFLRKDVPHNIDIEDEIQYIVEKWETSTSQTIPTFTNGDTTQTYQQLTQNSSHTQSETANGFLTGTVTLDKTEFILYVKLVRDNTTPPPPPAVTGDYILHESEITRAVSSAGGTDSKSIPISIKYDFPDLTFTCSGISHTYQDTETETVNGKTTTKTVDKTCTVSHTDSPSVTDSEVKVAVKNENEGSYTDVIAQTSHTSFKSVNPLLTLNRKTSELTADEKYGSHTYYFTIFRFKNGEENLNLAEYNQKQSSNADIKKGTTEQIVSGNASTVDDLGYTLASSKTTKNRASAGYVVDAVSFKFKYNSSASGTDARTEAKYSSSLSCSHGNSCSDHSKTGDITSTSEVTETADIAVQVYSGTANKPLHTKVTAPKTGAYGEKYLPENIRGMGFRPTSATSTTNVGNRTVGIMLQSNNTSIKFNPFVRMSYSLASELKDNTKKKYGVNVLSEYQREIKANDYAEVEWAYAGDDTHLVELKSQMWATDQALSNGTSWRQPNSVLKGGASCQISIPDTNMRSITLRTYQTVLPNSYSDFVTNADSLSESKAVTAHQDFIADAIDTFEQLHIVQRITTDVKLSGCLADEEKVERGGDISFLNNGSSTSSTDSKYYLSKDITGHEAGASDGDLDVKELATTKTFYKIWTDISGNVLIASGDNLDSLKDNINGTVILTKNQGIADLDESTPAKKAAIALNSRTLVIEKLLNAVERNTGNDSTADWASSDGKWYNESFSIYIMEQSTEIKLGFRDVTSRSLVIDPKLIPYLASKSQQGKAEAHTSQFTTDNFSNKYSPSESGKVGNFKGKSVYMKDMNKLLTSKLFYIPNMTVQNSR